MMSWITTDWASAVMVVISTLLLYVVVLVCVRVAGLRSLAKMSPTDFIWTVATGSLLATSITSPSPPVLLATVAFAMVFAIQWAVALTRRRSAGFERLISNTPVLLMDGPVFVEANLRRVNISKRELRAKLRESGVLRRDHVRAVVMETTGNISVLQTSDQDLRMDSDLLQDVEGSAEAESDGMVSTGG